MTHNEEVFCSVLREYGEGFLAYRLENNYPLSAKEEQRIDEIIESMKLHN